MAHGIPINYNDIYVEGISAIKPVDIKFAEEFGYKIKLLSISKNIGEAIEARVHPTMIPEESMLAKVDGSLNAVSISADAIGKMMLYGYGAGMMPTASAVMSDIIDVARNIIFDSQGRVPPLAYQPDRMNDKPILPIGNIMSNYYFRFSLVDKPSVLSKVSGILGKYDISIKSVHQKTRKPDKGVPVVIITHRAKEAEVKKAFEEISSMDVVTGKPVFIRIEDEIG